MQPPTSDPASDQAIAARAKAVFHTDDPALVLARLDAIAAMPDQLLALVADAKSRESQIRAVMRQQAASIRVVLGTLADLKINVAPVFVSPPTTQNGMVLCDFETFMRAQIAFNALISTIPDDVLASYYVAEDTQNGGA